MELGFGSFHMKYYYKEELVAVGVVDILPQCLSSVYVFYSPDHKHLELGRTTALREIQWVQTVCRSACPRLRYWYAGFYIHTCAKMKYKADYRPSDLLCPIRKRWVPLPAAIPFLESRPVKAFVQNASELSAGDNIQDAASSSASGASSSASSSALYGVLERHSKLGGLASLGSEPWQSFCGSGACEIHAKLPCDALRESTTEE